MVTQKKGEKLNFIYDQHSNHLRWLDKAYFAEANAVITVPPISDKDMEENRVTVTLGGKAVRVSGNDLRLAEERPQIEEEEALLSCPVCGASPDSLMLELVWIADSIGWQGVCTCSVCGTESIGSTSLFEGKALSEVKHTWNEGFVHIRRYHRGIKSKGEEE